MPTAKLDKAGNLIATKAGLLELYKTSYIERLTPKEAKPNYQSLQLMKEELFDTRLLIAALTKSNDWKSVEVVKTCKSLKNGKARDELGLIYELFKPNLAGRDLLNSIFLKNSKKKFLSQPGEII